MLNIFVDGLVFGGGFVLSFVAVWFAVLYLAMPFIMDSQMEMIDEVKGVINELPKNTITK